MPRRSPPPSWPVASTPIADGATVAIYRSLPTEPPTDALAAELHARGLPVLVPVLLPDKDLDWCRLLPDGSTGPALGLDAIARAAVVVTPALAVDVSGARLGQGGGSYDRALRRRAPGALVVAVVGDDELVPGPLPAEGHDVRVDAVVTPGRGMLRLPADAPEPPAAGHRPLAASARPARQPQASERSGTSRSSSASALRTACLGGGPGVGLALDPRADLVVVVRGERVARGAGLVDPPGAVEVTEVDHHAHRRRPVDREALARVVPVGVDDGRAAGHVRGPAVEQARTSPGTPSPPSTLCCSVSRWRLPHSQSSGFLPSRLVRS